MVLMACSSHAALAKRCDSTTGICGTVTNTPIIMRSAGPPGKGRCETGARFSRAVQVLSPRTAAGTSGGSAVRYVEFVEGKSSKFWEIHVAGCDVTVRYGRIGAAGTSKVAIA
jgi:hypothetical protein